MSVFGDYSKRLQDVLATTDWAPVETLARDKLHRIIDIFFSRFPQEQKRFTCIGQDVPFAPLLEKLRSDDSWEENNIKANSQAGNTNLSLLLLSISALKHNVFKNFVTEKKYQSELVLLCFETEASKKKIFPIIEAQGYRIFQEHNEYVAFFLHKDGIEYESELYPPGATQIEEALSKISRWKKSSFLQENAGRFISIPACNLLKARRFDIAIKAHYARLWRSDCAQKWREYVYYEHALRITGASKTIREYDGSGKEGLGSFLDNFHSLISEKKIDSIPFPPIDKNGIAMDGAHRIAAAIEKNEKIRCIQFDSESHIFSGYDFYTGISHGHAPCSQEVIDEAAIEYCAIKNTAAIALIFPSVPNAASAIEQLTSMASIVYQKNIAFSPAAGGGLLRQIYLGQPWLDWSGKQSGFLYKKRCCFPFSGELRVLLFDDYDPAQLRPVKEEIREIYGLGNHSIHITDSSEETLRAAQVLFNQNSIAVLKAGIGNLQGFHEKLFRLRDWIFINGINNNLVCVDGSAVLSVLGLRECRDIDFLYHGDPETLPQTPEKIDCHNESAGHYKHSIDEIIGDPRLHFWYMGVKFCTPDLILDMKQRRGEKKDKTDVQLLRYKSPYCSVVFSERIKNFAIVVTGYHRARLALFLRKVKNRLRPVVQKLRGY